MFLQDIEGGKNPRGFVPAGDRIDSIKITALLDAVGSFIELTLRFTNFCVDFRVDLSKSGIGTFSDICYTCDLMQTMKNMESFIDNFPEYLAAYQKEEIEFEKMFKIEQMAKASIKAGVAQVLTSLGYEWDLVDKGEYFALRIGIGKKKLVEMTLNDKNFTKRLSLLPETLKNIENLLKNLTFPVEISMNKELVKL